MNTLFDIMIDAIEACYRDKTGSIELYNQMAGAIDACHDRDEGQQIQDEGERLKYYARIAQNLDFERKVIRIRQRAERKAWRLLKEKSCFDGDSASTNRARRRITE